MWLPFEFILRWYVSRRPRPTPRRDEAPFCALTPLPRRPRSAEVTPAEADA
jgi:hypothetical protein